MSKHESTRSTLTATISRPWTEIDPKVIIGAASSVTVGAVVAAGDALGLHVPTWLAVVIVIAVYAIAAYLTKTRIPVPDDSGLTAQQVEVAGHVIAGADALAEEDLLEAAEQALRASADALAQPDGDETAAARPHPTD